MRHIRILLFLVLPLVASISLGQTKEEARRLVIEDVAQTKKSLPFTQLNVTIIDMEVKGNGYITYYVVDDRKIDFNMHIKNLESNKTESFIQTARNHPMFAKNLVLSGLNMAMVIKAKYSGKTEVVTLMSNELKKALLDYIRSTQ
jgi:hypothetical protein